MRAQNVTETLRATVPGMEDLLYTPIPLLDHGFVRVVDYMGGDGAVVQAARVSYGRGTRSVSDDRGLIRLPDAHGPHDPVRNVRDQAPREAAHLRAPGSGSGTAPPASTRYPPATPSWTASSTCRTR